MRMQMHAAICATFISLHFHILISHVSLCGSVWGVVLSVPAVCGAEVPRLLGKYHFAQGAVSRISAAPLSPTTQVATNLRGVWDGFKTGQIRRFTNGSKSKKQHFVVIKQLVCLSVNHAS